MKFTLYWLRGHLETTASVGGIADAPTDLRAFFESNSRWLWLCRFATFKMLALSGGRAGA